MARLTAAQISLMKQFFAQIGDVDSSWIVGDIDVSKIDGKDNWFTTLFDARLVAQTPALVTNQGTAAQETADQALAAIAAIVTVPTGAVLPFAMSTPPAGWLECDGAAVSRSTYADLFAAVGETFGPGDSATTFNLPDLRGQFVRGWDHGAGSDPDAATRTGGDTVGSTQADELKSHVHSIANLGPAIAVTASGSSDTSRATAGSRNTDSTGGLETRPKNIALMYCIKV